MNGDAVIDSLGMFAATNGLPEQIEAAVEASADLEGLPAHEDIENVVVLGMGGSGIAGDVLTVVAGPFTSLPIVVHKGYGIPNFISESTLVFVISFSGNTEETLEGAQEAAMAGGRVITISNGGELEAWAQEWGAPHIGIADGIPMPRAGIGAVSIPPLLVLEQMGHFPGATAWVQAAVEQLRRRRDELAKPDDVAEVLARRLERQIPIVYGGGGIGHVAAVRWKNQFNENAKLPAFANTIPEMTHNEIAGWGQDGDVTRQIFHVIELRHEFEHPQVARRFELANQWLEEVVAGIHTVEAEGEGPLAQLLDLVMVGDMTTLHAAVRAGVDPGPVPVLDDIKAALAAG